jgi:uncharacterized protein YbaR (Trm112 family)
VLVVSTTTLRILACPHAERHTGAEPLNDAPLCPYCKRPLDVIGVEIEGLKLGAATAVGLWCSCGYGFNFQNDNVMEGAAKPRTEAPV